MKPAARRPSLFFKVVVVALLLTCARLAYSQAPPVDVSAIGPPIGQPAPQFSGVDQFGRRHSLESLLGANGAMLVFFRSADW